jgi:hypothetical protein
MPSETRDLITWSLGTLVSLSVLIGLATKYVLLPWLRDHLVAPVRETHRQVAENGHANEEHPTIPDRLEDLGAKVDLATQAHADQARDLQAVTRVVDEHLRWSDRWVDLVDRELQLVKDQLRHKRTENDQ